MSNEELMNRIAEDARNLRVTLAYVCKRAGVSAAVTTRYKNGKIARIDTIGKLESAIAEIKFERAAVDTQQAAK